jgi:hypothetical protein
VYLISCVEAFQSLKLGPDYSGRLWNDLVIGFAKRRHPQLYGTSASPFGQRVSCPASMQTPPEFPVGPKKCPYCVELIKARAIVC